MATMFVRHEVKDFDAWKETYDEISSIRKERGVVGASVHRDPENPNLVIVVHKFKDLDSAYNFAESEDLREGMQQAGVLGKPEFWFGKDVEETPH